MAQAALAVARGQHPVGDHASRAKLPISLQRQSAWPVSHDGAMTEDEKW
jgi:hypothetical protein